MSEAASTTRKRSSSTSSSSSSAASEERAPVSSYEEALEVGYIGGPVDETDHTLAGEAAAAEAAEAEAS